MTPETIAAFAAIALTLATGLVTFGIKYAGLAKDIEKGVTMHDECKAHLTKDIDGAWERIHTLEIEQNDFKVVMGKMETKLENIEGIVVRIDNKLT